MNRFRVTYQVITEESSQDGDFAEHGYALPHGWKFPVYPNDVVKDDPIERYEMTLREACDITGRCLEDSGTWFSSCGPDQDYATGEDTYYSLHPPENITKSSYNRLKRLLTGR